MRRTDDNKCSHEPQKLKNAEYDVVDVAEAGSLALLGVVQPPGPVNGNVGVAFHETLRGSYK